MSKMMHDQPSAAVPASRDRRNFLIAGAGLALAATTLGRSGAVILKRCPVCFSFQSIIFMAESKGQNVIFR